MMLIFTTWIIQAGWIRALGDVGTGRPVLGPGSVLLASHVVCRQIEVVNPSVPSRPCVALVSCNRPMRGGVMEVVAGLRNKTKDLEHLNHCVVVAGVGFIDGHPEIKNMIIIVWLFVNDTLRF